MYAKLSWTAILWALLSTQTHAQDAWGALVVCCYSENGSHSGNGNSCGEGVSTGFGSGATQEAARASATNNAMSDTDQSSNWKCHAVRDFNHGCSYIAEGCNEVTKQCGWAIGVNQKDALIKLSRQGYAGGGGEHARGGGCVAR